MLEDVQITLVLVGGQDKGIVEVGHWGFLVFSYTIRRRNKKKNGRRSLAESLITSEHR
jgi:hypothetical protein